MKAQEIDVPILKYKADEAMLTCLDVQSGTSTVRLIGRSEGGCRIVLLEDHEAGTTATTSGRSAHAILSREDLRDLVMALGRIMSEGKIHGDQGV